MKRQGVPQPDGDITAEPIMASIALDRVRQGHIHWRSPRHMERVQHTNRDIICPALFGVAQLQILTLRSLPRAIVEKARAHPRHWQFAPVPMFFNIPPC
jgi:hypothetical protein